MIDIRVCPSSLQKEFITYSPKAAKSLFGVAKVNPILGLDRGLSPDIEKSDVMERTGHPCRLDFELFGIKIGLVKKRIDKILDKYTVFPEEARQLVDRSFLSGKMKRNYVRVVNERISRFIRESE